MVSRKDAIRDIKVLQSIFFLNTPTRNEIARHTGRSPVSITSTLTGLLNSGMVERSGKTQSRSGRPSATYRLGQNLGTAVGISLEEGDLRLVALDACRQIVLDERHALSLSENPASHLDDILGQISGQLHRFLVDARLAGRKPLSIGLSLPGIVDTEKGIWLHGLQVSGITHVAIGAILEGKFGVPVVVDDLSRCLAFREAFRRPAETSRNLVYLYLGSGVGAGIIIDQEPFYGAHGMAGEVGHLVVEEEGARCSCGNIGCLETVVSRASILQRFQTRLAEGVISSLQRYKGNGEGSLTLEVIRDAATAGDRLAQSTLFELGTLLGDAVSKIIKLYNPRTLVIGGPVGVLGEHMREPLWIKVRQKVIPEMLVDLTLEIVPSQPNDEAMGAALLAERRFWRNPPAGVFGAE